MLLPAKTERHVFDEQVIARCGQLKLRYSKRARLRDRQVFARHLRPAEINRRGIIRYPFSARVEPRETLRSDDPDVPAAILETVFDEIAGQTVLAVEMTDAARHRVELIQPFAGAQVDSARVVLGD